MENLNVLNFIKDSLNRRNRNLHIIYIMIKAKNFIAFIFSLALLTSTSLACSGPNTALDLMKTDTVTLQNSGSGSEACYTVNIDYNVPPTGFQTAVSVANLWGLKTNQGLDYSVRGKQKLNSNVLALSLLIDSKSWTKITVSYLVSSRSDLYAGVFLADAWNQYDCSITGNQQYAFATNIPAIPIGYEYQVRVFIAGIEVKDTKFTFAFKKATFNVSTGLLDVRASANSLPHIENIHISYIIYRSNIPLTMNIIPVASIKNQDYAFQITNSFAASVPEVLAITFDSDRLKCIGNGCANACTNNCINIPNCNSYGGFWQGKSCVICGPNEKRDSNNQCIPNCLANEVYNSKKGLCECQQGLVRDSRGVCNYQCGNNEIWSNNKCICQSGCGRLTDGKCYICPANSIASNQKCVCNKDYYWHDERRVCDYVAPCPPNSIVGLDGNKWKCICNKGYTWNQATYSCEYLPVCPPHSSAQLNSYGKWECKCDVNYYLNSQTNTCDYVSPCGPYANVAFVNGLWQCVCDKDCYGNGRNCKPYPICPPGAQFNIAIEQCVCPQGQTLLNGVCAPIQVTPPGSIAVCPLRSRWNQDKLLCECTVPGEYMINNNCQTCKFNQVWNGKQCACVSGYYKIDGVCRTCDINSFYDGHDCDCNIGFYGNGREKCYKCHSSCGKCLGPNEDQCTICSDVSYTFNKRGDCGTCTRNAPCPIGLYNDQGDCKPCSSYCASCQSENVCKTCVEGFEIKSMSYGGLTYSYCVETCGDGKRFELDCDDGNRIDGDGCNRDCQIQKGWTCSGGSSIRPSTCVSYAPSRTYINLTGTVHLFGKVVQGVRLNYIPPQLTANDCLNCYKLLWVRVISSSVVPSVKVNYLPKSQYQFMTEFDFNGLFSIPVFTISIQINPDFAKYFTEADLAQIEVKSIDPSVLATHDGSDDLDAQQINPFNPFPPNTEDPEHPPEDQDIIKLLFP